MSVQHTQPYDVSETWRDKQFEPAIVSSIPTPVPTHFSVPKQVIDYALVYLADRRGPAELIYLELQKVVAATTATSK